MNTNGWTPERRKRQAELIRTWKPWLKSTGAKTIEGKAKASQNAHKHGMRGQAWKDLTRALRNQQGWLKNLI